MKTNRELRQEAWNVAVSRWTFRMMGIICSFTVLAMILMVPLAMYFQSNGIQTWSEYFKTLPPSSNFIEALDAMTSSQFWRLTWASAFQSFLGNLVQGIYMFGLAVFALRAIDDRNEGWFTPSLAGLRQPIAMFWLVVLKSLCILLWTLLFIIPGIIAVFRYVMAWYVKAEHPDYSASRCLYESGVLMNGHKWDFFFFELSYIGWWLLTFAVIAVYVTMAKISPAVGLLVFPMVLIAGIFLSAYLIFGVAAFYRELKRISKNNTDNSATVAES